MSRARIPSPEDFSLSWGDVLLLVEGKRGTARITALIHKFGITEKTASAWLEGAQLWAKQNRVKT